MRSPRVPLVGHSGTSPVVYRLFHNGGSIAVVGAGVEQRAVLVLQRGVAGLGVLGDQHADEAVEERDRRDGEQCPHDAGEHASRSQAEHHAERVNRHGPPHHQGLQDVRLELHHGHDQPERDRRVDQALREQRDDDGEETRDERADEGDEGAEEDQRGQRQRQRNAHDAQAAANGDGVDERNEGRRPGVAGQRVEARGACLVDAVPVLTRHDLRDEPRDVAAAEQEEDDGEQAQQRAGQDLDEGARGGQGAGRQLGLMRAQGVDGGVGGAGDLVGPQVCGAVDQPVPGAVGAALDLVHQIGCAFDELIDDEREDAAEHGDPEDEDERDGASAGGAGAVEVVDGGQQQRGAQHRPGRRARRRRRSARGGGRSRRPRRG